ncbi:MAG: HYR domain-containing protein, partial [Flavobacteriales bacterium]
NTQATGNNLLKIQSNGNWNGGAASWNTVSNNGYFQFTATETNTARMVGLSNTNTDADWTAIQYIVYLRNDAQWEVRQSGGGALFTGPYAASDIFRIAVENNVVRYYQNNILRYTSLVPPTLPLLVDVSINTQGGTVTNAVVANISNAVFTATAVNAGSSPTYQWKLNGVNVGTNSPTYSNGLLANGAVITCELTPDIPGCAATSYVSNIVDILPITQPLTTSIVALGVLDSPSCQVAEGPVVWNPSSLVNTSATNNNLAKFQSGGAWNGGAASSNTVSNNGYFQFTATETNTDRVAGLSTTNVNADWTSIQYAIYLRSNTQWTVHQSGGGSLFTGTYAANDVFRIAVENNVVRYYRNNVLAYTSLVSPTLPMLADVSINTLNGTITNALIANTNNGTFTVTVSGVGSNPTYQWQLNGSNVGTNSASYTNTTLSTGNVITCLVTPDLPGCSTTQYPSNNITIRAGVPVIVCPPNQTIVLDASCQAVMPDYRPLVTFPSNCVHTLAQSPAPGTILTTPNPLTVTITATNTSGVSTTCSFGLSPLDNIPPVVNCPANITVNAPAGACGAVVNYTVTGSDNCIACGGGTIPGHILIGSFNNRFYYRSTASATWPVANAAAIALGGHLVAIGSAAENAFLSGIGRHWTGLNDQAVEGTWVWSNGEPVTYLNWAGGQPDNSGNEDFVETNWSGQQWNDFNGSLPYIVEFSCFTNLVSGLASGSTFPVGTTTVTYNATDASGNQSAPCSFTVTVNDVTPPTILCPANITVNSPAGSCSAVVNYTTPTAYDNCGGCSGGTPAAIPNFTYIGDFGTKRYYRSNASATWPVANTTAISLGGHLATIANAAENAFLSGVGRHWIGLNDQATEGTWAYSNGEPVNYLNWGPGQPDNSGNEDFVETNWSGQQWNDFNGSLPFIVEFSCITPTLVSGLASGASFPAGVTTVTYQAADASGNVSTCSFTVTVNDTQSPVITCPANITTTATTGVCTAPVTYSVTATDNCSSTITQTAGLPSGSLFPVGVTTNTFVATDPAGNSTTCTFTVTVTDTEPPVALCQNATVTLGSSPAPSNGSISGIINTYTAVSAITANTVTVSSATGFSAGQKVLLIQMQGASITTTNNSSFGTLTSAAQAGNYEFARISSISGNVITFSGNIANTYDTSGGLQLVTVPEYNNVTVTAAVNAQAWNGTTGGIIAFDALGTVTMNAAINANGSGFRGGAVSVNQATSCSFTGFALNGPSGQAGQKGEGISIVAAAVSAGRGRAANGGGAGNAENAGGAGGANGGNGGNGGDQWSGCGTGGGGGIAGSGLSALFAQNKIFLGGGGGGGQANSSVGSSGANGGGIIIISAQSIASNGNQITANGSNALNATFDGAGGGGAGGSILLQVNTFTNPTTVQARGGTGGNANNDHGTGGGGGGGLVRHVGATPPANLTISVTGGANGTAGGVARNATAGAAGIASGNLSLPQSGPFVMLSANQVNNGSTDNCGIASVTVSPQAFDCGDVGPNTVTLTVTDASGNISTCTATVTVADGITPTITCPANIVTTTSPGTCTSSVVTPNPTTSDNCGVNRLSWVLTGATTGSSPVTGINNLGTQVFNGGITTVTYTVGDTFGNTTTCSFTVTVNDNIAPTITCPANVTLPLGASCNVTLPSYTAATLSDNCTAAGAITVVQSPAAGTVLSGAGTTTVTLTATDAAGNSSSCSFNVVRADQTAPVITCPANQTVAFSPSCNFTLPSYTGLATAADNCDTSLTLTQSPAAGTVITAATTITLTATDDAGNFTTCTFQVIPTDQTAPSVTCPANQTVAFTASCDYTLLSYTALAVTADNCDASVTVTQSPAAGTVI